MSQLYPGSTEAGWRGSDSDFIPHITLMFTFNWMDRMLHPSELDVINSLGDQPASVARLLDSVWEPSGVLFFTKITGLSNGKRKIYFFKQCTKMCITV